MHHLTDRKAHNITFLKPFVEEQEIAQWDRSDNLAHHQRLPLLLSDYQRARCSFVERVFAHDAMGRWIEPS